MSWTRSLLELPFSPIEVTSGEQIIQLVDLTNYLASGSINSPTVKVMGGPLDCEDLWTDLTSSVVSGSVTPSGNTLSFTLHAFTVGYGYRVILTWNSAVSTYQTLTRFFIARCIY